MAKKIYVVWKGRNPGIYYTWDECKKQIDGFSNPQYKSYTTLEEAQQAFQNQKTSSTTSNASINYDSICVDAACAGNPGRMEYQCVFTQTKEVLFASPPYEDGTNNIGEFLAIVHALAFCKKKGSSITIYTDSATAMSWVKKKKANTKLERTSKNGVLFDLIARAEIWLNSNTYSNTILKWDTAQWGEIPADYGRK
ncbi:MAG: ribonuclease H family protein [Bacteroidota bacterium]